MKVSLITASYNSEFCIKRCIHSVNQQTFNDIQHIFIDGLSSDSTVRLIEEEAKRSPVIICEPDSGIYDALNKGLARSNGDIIGFAHTDDFFYDADVISSVVDVFKSNPEVDIVFGDLNYVKLVGIDLRLVRIWRHPRYFVSLRFGWMPPHPATFYRRQLFDEVGNFDKSFLISGDYEHLIRCFREGSRKYFYLPKVLTNMTMGGTSNGSFNNLIKKSNEDLRAIRRHRISRCPHVVLFLKQARKLLQFLGNR